MARKLKLSPLQRDVLWLLEEAGSETRATLAATLCRAGAHLRSWPLGRAEPASPEELERAVEVLCRLGLVARDADEVVLTDEGRDALAR